MNADKRRLEIYNKVMAEKKVTVQKLAEDYNVSAMTIRRDLSILEKQRVVTVVYGGAYLNDNVSDDMAFELSKRKMQEEKLGIAYEASRLIHNSDLVFLGIGSTCYEITRFLKNEKLVIVTNSMMVVNNLEDKDKIDVIVPPGRFIRNARAILSVDAIAHIKKYNFDIAFLSPKYFDVQKGATVIDETEAALNQAIIRASKRVYLLADSDKFGKSSFIKFADSTEFTGIITDDRINPAFVEQCREKQIELKIAKAINTKNRKSRSGSRAVETKTHL